MDTVRQRDVIGWNSAASACVLQKPLPAMLRFWPDNFPIGGNQFAPNTHLAAYFAAPEKGARIATNNPRRAFSIIEVIEGIQSAHGMPPKATIP